MNRPNGLPEREKLTRWAGWAGIAVGLVGVTITALWGLVEWVGIINAILYTLLFVVGVSLLPFLIALAGADMPFNGAIGRLHVLLGAIAFNHHYLVDLGDRWDWCPGDKDRVYIEGQWYKIEAGFENRSVLGWRPFGILRFKGEDTLQAIRADTAAERGRGHTAADGGEETIERGGYDQKAPPAIPGDAGEWLIDLKRLFSRGIKAIGDTTLVETAEEVIERGEVTQSAFEGWQPIIGAFLGLLFGVVVGYLTFFG